jgi:8-oxo-dGTP diphosphatase
MPKKIEVVAAVIEYKGRLMAFRRGESKYSYVSNKFEFPGGKVEQGEDLRLALKRELNEELELNATVKDFIDKVEHDYEDFSIIMHCFLVQLKEFSGTLNEHTEYRDISLSEAGSLDWIAADRPILEILKSKFNHVFTG